MKPHKHLMFVLYKSNTVTKTLNQIFHKMKVLIKHLKMCDFIHKCVTHHIQHMKGMISYWRTYKSHKTHRICDFIHVWWKFQQHIWKLWSHAKHNKIHMSYNTKCNVKHIDRLISYKHVLVSHTTFKSSGIILKKQKPHVNHSHDVFMITLKCITTVWNSL